MSGPAPRRLLIISHVTHYQHEGRLHAYAAYAREIDLWADLFPEVLIASPCHKRRPTPDCAPFIRSNIGMIPLPETGGTSFGPKLRQILMAPYLALRLVRAGAQADAVHVRCPGNLGLLGALVAPLCSRYRVAKYAGNWAGYPGEPWSFRLQRRILASRWWTAPVTVYGEWPNDPAHIVPFFTSVMTDDQVERARVAAATRKRGSALRVLYVGRLAPNKNVDVLISAVAELQGRGIPVDCVVIGDGPLRSTLEAHAAGLGLQAAVRFLGALPFDEVQRWYERCDTLVLASDAEGWPKAVAEAMTYGLVCVASDRGFTSRMLGEGRGVLVQPRDLAGLSAALAELAADPGQAAHIGGRAAAWACRYSLEGLGRAIRELLTERWKVDFDSDDSATGSEALAIGKTG